MSAAPIQVLQTVLEQAEAQRDAAAVALHEARQASQRNDAQADQLRQYRAETQARWTQNFRRQGAIEIVHCYRGFMDRLDQATAQQERACSQAAAAVERARRELADRERRVSAVRKLIERRARELQRTEARRDQRQTDEAAQRSAWTRRPGPTADSRFH